MDRLRDYESDFPNYWDMAQQELDRVRVPVKDIIGGNPFASKNYTAEWEALEVEYDSRYKRVEQLIRDRKKNPNANNEGCLDLGYIHLFSIYCETLQKVVYYVCGDGHRRVSWAHKFSIKEIFARVTHLYNKP